jgi:hypothetical protein
MAVVRWWLTTESRAVKLFWSRAVISGPHLPPTTVVDPVREHSRDAVLLVFTSERYYDADDYIRDHGDFIALTAGER